MKVLLSIKPEFVEKIFSGEKLYEYRKVFFRRPNISTVVLYATNPIRRIVGEFEIADVLEDSPQKIWEKTKYYSGTSKLFFTQYFAGRDYGYAIRIGPVQKYGNAINPYVRQPGFVPPQSFRYI